MIYPIEYEDDFIKVEVGADKGHVIYPKTHFITSSDIMEHYRSTVPNVVDNWSIASCCNKYARPPIKE
jgi:hypothetical protein